ncbi:MAG: acyl--CoA ligase [Curvibacter lanceolatus]|uniref:class I adenylate-forming enzyme family protein n=1 Tax=Curvibacter lanceolatus TaxID=86182 RepID=UPI0003703EBC|nr:class I adenylate-forming enzyme family protein [Curvibacter lanceolatus]MBV5294453.1 acyl--CoA ligase [Curvibacter lanceolatus]
MTHPPTRLHHLFDQRLAATPDAVFLHLTTQTLSYAQLGTLIDTLQAELLAQGVLPGDRVLAVAENCPEHVALVLACSRVGAWSCGVNARMARGEIEAFVAKADPRLVYFTCDVGSAAREHGEHLGAQPSALAGLSRTARREQATPEPAPLAQQVVAIIFTSGTTGAPKGVLVSHAGLLQFARVSAESRALTPADRSYACVPMTHIFGLGTVLAASLHAGAALVMRSRFEPADALQALAMHQVSNLQGPPALFTRLLAWLDEQGVVGQPPAPALRYVYTGAAPLDLPLKNAVQDRFGQPLHHGYGLSEYAGAACLVRRGQWREDTAAGVPVEGAQCRIVDDTGRELPQGERGEIWLRGVGLMPGYFRDPVATAQVMREGGWYATGDLGRIGPDGALHVVGRLKEMIIRSGFNVYPGEVENVLNQHPRVQRSAVVGRKEADGNETVLAFVETVGGQPLGEADQASLQALLHDQLAPYKRPASITALEALPMTHSGKVLKRALLDLPTPV